MYPWQLLSYKVLPDWFQWWHVKNVECHNKICSKLLCLGQFHVTKVDTCNFTRFYRILCNVMYDDLHRLNKHGPDFIHLSFNDGLSPGPVCFTDPTSLITQCVPLVNQHFWWWFSSKTPYEISLGL
jgi:hypothetical protein